MAPRFSKQELQYIALGALDIFKSIMPPIQTPYPAIYIADGRNYRKMRTQIVSDVGCQLSGWPHSDSMMEYIHGTNDGAIIIRQNLLTNFNEEAICCFFWHELGHFYAINTEPDGMYRLNDPELQNHTQETTIETLTKQNGYWFWQEFIAETISQYVSMNDRKARFPYHPEQIQWHPAEWGGLPDLLLGLLDESFSFFSINDYALAHYFAQLLMNDAIVLYIQVAKENRLQVYQDGMVVYPDEPIEPTCISDIEPIELQEPMWKLKSILDKQVAKEHFWCVTEDDLYEMGRCIQEIKEVVEGVDIEEEVEP